MKRFSTIIIFYFIMNSMAIVIAGEYTESCSQHAKKFLDAVEKYDYAKSELEYAKLDFESAKLDFESACDSYYGYSKDDESACGTYGYERNSFENAVDTFENVASEFEYAMERLNRFCGICQNVSNSISSQSKN